MDITVNNEMEIEWTVAEDSLCIFDNSFDFTATSNSPLAVNYTWDFGNTATPGTATGQTVDDVVFSNSGLIPVTVYGVSNLCEAEYTSEVFIYAEPIAEMVLPDDIECEGLIIDFGNNSQNASDFAWDFGDPGSGVNSSSIFEPTHTYSGPGTYTVTLSAWSSPSCVDQVEETFTLNEELVVSFVTDDSQCITGNSFNFDGTVSGPPNAVYTWNFGPNANIQSSNDVDVNGVEFTAAGTIPVTLTGSFDDCVESVTQEIYLYSPPTIGFDIEPGLQCAPFDAQFIDQSWAETEIFYNWDFGDGNTSTEQNPTNLYDVVGPYPVTLTIYTTEGCIDTLTLLQADLVHVRPNPVAGFSVTPDYTDICNSEVQFIDESQGGYAYFYWFDDSTIFYNGYDPNPTHQYLFDGNHFPTQIVTNEWGCRDTARSQVTIEPFTLYIPNTFTPDGDERNNIFKAVNYLYIYEWELKVYNRWGQIIFESEDVDEGWDGTLKNGQYAQDGTYGYTIRYRTCEPLKPDKFITGHINLLR
jgi:gliding motility-associated-like protein